MTLELKVPSVGESITEVEIGEWLKKEGEKVNKDEEVVSLESEKATVELPAPSGGTLVQIVKKTGEKASVGEVIGYIDPAAVLEEAKTPVPETPKTEPVRPEPARARVAAKSRPSPPSERVRMPAAHEPAEASAPPGRQEEKVPMTPLRRTVAERLVEARQSMAMVTTFNEIDMSGVSSLRKEYQESFTREYGIKLGVMSFFVKAVIYALRRVPQLNASVSGNDIIYHNYFDIAVAVSSERGLVVPVLRNADRLSFADTEKLIGELAGRAQENKLKPEELTGGTFTISNGGIFGSLLSTPIINPPQSGILGMHSIQERPVAVGGSVVIRPMMYAALSYDHRIVDGREGVTFLRHIKEVIETPARILIEV